MDLIGKLFTELETEDLDCVLLGLQKTIENDLGFELIEENLPNIYDKLEKDDTIWGSEQFRQYADLYPTIVSLRVYDHPLLGFLEYAELGCLSYELETLESQLSEQQREELDLWIEKINQISNKRQLFLLKKDCNLWFVDWSCDMYDYENGSVTGKDMQVRKEIAKRLSEEYRVVVVLESGYSIEV